MEDHLSAPTATEPAAKPARVPWNKGEAALAPEPRLVDPDQAPNESKKRDLALFIDSKLRGCDAVAVRR